MTREEAKKLLPFIQAFSEGKTIQSKCITDEMPLWWDDNNPTFEIHDFDYRIKPEPMYRPFKNVEECWNEMKKHQPFGWLKDKEDGHYTMVTTVDAAAGEGKKHIKISGGNLWTLAETMSDYTFADGTPFGIEENFLIKVHGYTNNRNNK